MLLWMLLASLIHTHVPDDRMHAKSHCMRHYAMSAANSSAMFIHCVPTAIYNGSGSVGTNGCHVATQTKVILWTALSSLTLREHTD